MNTNPYSTQLRKLFRRLAQLNGALQHFDLHLGSTDYRIRRDLRKGKSDYWQAGVALLIRDLTEWPTNGWARLYPTAVYARKGRQFLHVLGELHHATNTWAVSQGYEAFERFLKDQVAVFLKRNSTLLKSQVWRWPEKKRLDIPSRKTNTLYSEFVRDAYNGAGALLSKLRKTIGNLREAESNNNRGVSLISWMKVVSEVRHAQVHAGGVIVSARLQSLQKVERNILASDFPGRQTGEGWVLEFADNKAEEALARFAEYGNLVSKTMSQYDELSWQIPSVGRV
jgi:hypothetical protein